MIRDKEYLDYVRSFDCAVKNGECSAHMSYNNGLWVREIHPHHMRTRGAGGDDLFCVPLCKVHHDMWHKIGRDTFEKKYPGKIETRWLEVLEGAIYRFPEFADIINERIELINNGEIFNKRC